jgi:hydrogenase maturation protease
LKILLLGIGNIMFADEGVGVHLCRLLSGKYRFSAADHTIEIVDGGTLAQLLSPIIAQFDYCVIFDCVAADGGKAGDVYFFDFTDIPNGVSYQGTAHEVEMLQTLAMMDLAGDRPPTKIIGIIPAAVEGTGLTMSEEVLKGAIVMEKVLVKHLTELGVNCEVIAPEISLQEVADQFGGKNGFGV